MHNSSNENLPKARQAATSVCLAAGNPALKMQHWMKNQLVKESYSGEWEDIVRSSSAKKPSQTPDSSSQTKLPAEFGTKDKVPASGTAPMGMSDYKDKNQWVNRKDVLNKQDAANPSKGSAKPKSPMGYLGGDGARLSPVDKSAPDSVQPSRHETASSDGASSSGQGRLPDQASPASRGRGDHTSNGASPSGSTARSNGASRQFEGSIGDTSQLSSRTGHAASASDEDVGNNTHLTSRQDSSTGSEGSRDDIAAQFKPSSQVHLPCIPKSTPVGDSTHAGFAEISGSCQAVAPPGKQAFI